MWYCMPVTPSTGKPKTKGIAYKLGASLIYIIRHYLKVAFPRPKEFSVLLYKTVISTPLFNPYIQMLNLFLTIVNSPFLSFEDRK